MTLAISIVLIITVVAIFLFATELLSVDVTAFLIMVALMVVGLFVEDIVSPTEGISGFSNVATITVFALLVLSLGLQSTGVVNYMGYKLESLTGTSEWRITFFTLVIVGLMSAFMNNTAIVAIFLPIVNRLANFANISPSKFLMPLSFAAMIGGASTIIGTSTNILVSAIYLEHSGESFGIFEFSYLGILFFVAFLLYMMLIGQRIIPERKKKEASISLTKEYDIQQYLMQVDIRKGSPMIGKRLADTELVKHYRVRVIELIRKEGDVWLPNQIVALREGDTLLIKANIEDLFEIQEKAGIRIKRHATLDDQELTSEDAILFEAVIGQNSFLVGKQIKDVDFRQLFAAIPLAVRRSGVSVGIKVSDMVIQFGDVLLMEARRRNLNQFYNSPDFIVLEKVKKPNLRKDKMLLSVVIVLGVIALAAFNLMPIVVSSLMGCALLLVTGCISIGYIYRKMDWRVIFLLAGILPLGIAVENSGLGALIAQGIIHYIGSFPPSVIIAVLFLITTLLTSFMSNNATAILLAPIAITIAEQLGLPVKPFLITVMFAASTSFLTPIGYQTNTLVYGAGQYAFMDFVKVGGLLTLLVWILATVSISYFFF